MLDIRFTNETNGRNIDAAASLLLQPRLWIPGGDYPDHQSWVEMAMAEIEDEQKRAMVAWVGTQQAGVLVYQRHKADPNKLEIKNLSVSPSARGRRIADFLFRQVEIEAPLEFPGIREIVGDAKITSNELIRFAVHNGMAVTLAPCLESNFATNGIPDVLFNKLIRLQSEH